MALALQLRQVGPGLVTAIGLTWMTARLSGTRSWMTAVVMHGTLMHWAAGAFPKLLSYRQSRYFHVAPWEAPLYIRLGTYTYMHLLRAVGWESWRRRTVGFTGRPTLGRLEQATREAEISHLILGGFGLTLATLAIRRRIWQVAFWHVLLVIGLHLYPVLLQRTLRARLQRYLPSPEI